jgi:hypothetical protein
MSMAQRVDILLVDDIDGSEAGETVQFGLDGARYEIDLNAPHARDLRAALTGYIDHGRKAHGRPARTRRTAVNGGTNTKEVREWAKAQGFKVNERGRIPADIIAKYAAANGR